MELSIEYGFNLCKFYIIIDSQEKGLNTTRYSYYDSLQFPTMLLLFVLLMLLFLMMLLLVLLIRLFLMMMLFSCRC